MHEHGYDQATGQPAPCPMVACWWNEEMTD